MTRVLPNHISPRTAAGFLFPKGDCRAPLPCFFNIKMSELKKGQAVKARTMRSDTYVPGTVTEIVDSRQGKWVTVQPDDKAAKPFKTRPALCTPA